MVELPVTRGFDVALLVYRFCDGDGVKYFNVE